ncbi:MAG: hypothetical protein R2708_05195 [Vicinamibacterales bacterium]
MPLAPGRPEYFNCRLFDDLLLAGLAQAAGDRLLMLCIHNSQPQSYRPFVDSVPVVHDAHHAVAGLPAAAARR